MVWVGLGSLGSLGGPTVERALDTAVEVFHSPRAGDCRERALVLEAVGIASETHAQAPLHVLLVAEADAPRAREQLALYERERRPAPPAPSAPPPLPHAWIGCALYAVVLIFIGLAITNGLWPPAAFDAGTLDAGRLQAGQWWRAWTALTLHLDGEHLVANLLGGIWFGYLAGRQQGPGHAWFLVVSGAAGANLVEGLLAPATHRAVGASTAVFTALGLLSAYAWGTHARWAQRWALQWAPLVCGAVLLAWFGSGAGDAAGGSGAAGNGAGQVDVVAHAFGFIAGVLLGLVAARPLLKRLLRRLPQWLTGLLALAQIAVAWRFALGS
ncbi:MAG TPA: rhomboid family intramembrane serine protease [Steroidobacteraceae bacterium]|nr:rhomboid family intramembrane serine protease [Steroidobacteraceae bacterium]